MAEGRGGVVKLSFTTDLVPNLQRSRGVKRRRFIYNPKTSKDYRRELRRNLTPAEALLWRALKNSSLEGKEISQTTRNRPVYCRLLLSGMSRHCLNLMERCTGDLGTDSEFELQSESVPQISDRQQTKA